MTSTTEWNLAKYYEDKANDVSEQMYQFQELTGNRYGIITGCLHAILGYQQKYAANIADEAFEAMNQAQAWMQWADMLPKEKWLNYNEARELPFKFRGLWKEYKASGTSETFITWLENK